MQQTIKANGTWFRRLWHRARFQFELQRGLIREDGWTHVRYLVVPLILTLIWRVFVPKKPGWPRVVDIETIDGERFMVMEFEPGGEITRLRMPDPRGQ